MNALNASSGGAGHSAGALMARPWMAAARRKPRVQRPTLPSPSRLSRRTASSAARRHLASAPHCESVCAGPTFGDSSGTAGSSATTTIAAAPRILSFLVVSGDNTSAVEWPDGLLPQTFDGERRWRFFDQSPFSNTPLLRLTVFSARRTLRRSSICSHHRIRVYLMLVAHNSRLHASVSLRTATARAAGRLTATRTAMTMCTSMCMRPRPESNV